MLLDDYETIEIAARYLIDEILPKNSQVYTQQYVRDKLGRGDFISAIYHRGLNYNDILFKAGLNLNIDFKKWHNYYYDKVGNRLTYHESVNRFGKYLLKLKFKNEWNLNSDEAPTYMQLGRKNSDFLNAFSILGIRYNEIIEEAGLKINHPWGIYNFLDKDKKGNQIHRNDAISLAAQFLKTIILTQKFVKIHGLEKEEPPLYSLLENTHSGFINAITIRKLSFPKILRKAGFRILGQRLLKEIGNDSHIVLERLFIIISKKNCCLAYYEIYPNIKTIDNILYQKFGKNHCDNSILVDENFKALSEWTQNLPEYIEIVNIDYYLGNSKKVLAQKCLRGYQGRNKLLVLVPLHATKYDILQTPYYVPYRKNIIVMDPYSFAKNFGYRGKFYQGFIECIRLIKKSVYKEGSRKHLSNMAESAKEYIINHPEYSQKGLENYLNSDDVLRMDLLEYST
jgi:hypothetical protein